MNDLDFFFSLVVFFILATLGSLSLKITKNHRTDLMFQVQIFLCAFAARYLVSLAIYSFGLVDVIGDEDSSGWLVGVAYYKEWVRQGVSLVELPGVLSASFFQHHRGYYYLLGAFFYISDTPARLPAAVLNCFFGAITVVFAYRIAASLFGRWVAIRVGWLVCLFPSMLLWSAQTLKEPVVILLETIALYGCVQLKKSGFSVRHLALCCVAILLVIPFRFYAAYIAGAAVVLTLLLPQLGGRKLTAGSAVALMTVLIPILVMSGILVQQEAQFQTFDLQYIDKFRRAAATGTGSGVVTDFDLTTPEGLGLATMVGAAHLLLAPFPWQLGGGSIRMLMTLPELVVWWWLFFVGVIPGLWHSIRRRFSEIQALLFFLLGMGLLYSMIFGNIGLVYRHRAQLLPWLLIFAVVGLEQRMRKRHPVARHQTQFAGERLTVERAG